MGLEELPDLQLLQGFIPYVPIEPVKLPVREFSGAFITLKCPDGNIRLFSIKDRGVHRDIQNDSMFFLREAFPECHGYETTGGGFLKIDPEEIRVCDSSTTFGKYSLEIVRPIIERFARAHFPTHRLVFD